MQRLAQADTGDSAPCFLILLWPVRLTQSVRPLNDPKAPFPLRIRGANRPTGVGNDDFLEGSTQLGAEGSGGTTKQVDAGVAEVARRLPAEVGWTTL